MADTTLVLIDLNSQASFEFQFFPDNVKTVDRANWTAQETTIGAKPLFYANREPRTLTFSELYFDNTDTNESLTQTLEDLRAFTMDEVLDMGAPPALLATWGDQSLRCVLHDLTIEQIFFTDEGNPIRARLSIELLELQPEGEGTGVRDSQYTEDVV